MDIRKCIDILKERKCGCESHTMGFLSDLAPVPEGIPDYIISQTALDLVNLFLSLQAERVQTYHIYDDTLRALIAQERIGEYPMLCMEVTSRFAAISKTIKEIASELRCRGHISVATYIDSIQKNEKEKLLLYAAKHMDELQAGSDLLKPHLDTTPQTDYNNDHLQRLEIIISEAIEGIQCEKVEMVEADSSDPTVSA